MVAEGALTSRQETACVVARRIVADQGQAEKRKNYAGVLLT